MLPLQTKKSNLDLVPDHREDLFRLAGSLKYKQATASLIAGTLSASSRRNARAVALKEYGAIGARPMRRSTCRTRGTGGRSPDT
ncbi:Tn3 family transposase [Streptomyces scopuliridis]|uniref:Tn3 family transposase n=1 Tax=Streptomyces scopuliridis TaxID=452529 RepID=UPI0036C14D03